MFTLHQIAGVVAPWADFYNASKMTQGAMMFGHLGGMMTGGGAALYADRATLRLRLTDQETTRHLDELRGVHPVVLISLAIMALTGVAMLLADVESLAVAPIFWAKMLLVGALLVNGGSMLRLERALDLADIRAGRHWTDLRRASIVSLTLWLTLVLLGSLLPIFA